MRESMARRERLPSARCSTLEMKTALYVNQNGRGCDIRRSLQLKEVTCQRIHHDVEIKYYNDKASVSLLGDAKRKYKKSEKV